MKRFSISIRTLAILSVIAAFILILPLVLTAFFNRPAADDLIQPYAAAVAYRETGSFFHALGAAIQETIRIWNDRSGIFTSMFVSVFAPYVFNYKLGFIHPILLIILIICALYRFTKCLHLINKEIPSAYIWLITMVLSISVLTLMPSIYEAFYWYSGAISYTLFFALSVWLFSSLIASVHTHDSTPAAKRNLLLIVYCIGCFFFGGANWMTPTYSIVIYGFIAIWIFAAKKPKRYLLPLVFLLLGFGLAIIAPGNANRQAVVGERVSLISAFVSSFQETFRFCLRKGLYYFIPLLLVPIFVHLSRYMPKIPHYFLLAPVLSICILAAAYFPLFYSAYPIFIRHTTMIFFLFNVLLVASEAIIVFWITQRIPRLAALKDTFSLPCSIAMVCAVAFLILNHSMTFVRFSPFDCYSNYIPLKAAMHLVQGYSKNYAGSYDHLVYTLQTTDEKIVLSDPSLHSPLLGSPDLQLDPAHWVNQGFVQFHTDKDILLTQPKN